MELSYSGKFGRESTSTLLTNSIVREQDKQQTRALSKARKVITFILLSFVYFLTWCCFSLWATFLPIEATKRGVTSTEVGFIYGTYSLVSFLAALIYGHVLIPRIGPYFLLFAGLFLNAGASLICGYLDLIKERVIFTTYCFIIRAFGAIGGAACETTIIVIVTEEFRDNIAITIGMLRVFTGLGFIIGPLIGGGLYSIGGFRLPMVSTGGALMTALPLVFILLPRKGSLDGIDTSKPNERSNMTLRQALSIPGVAIMCAAYFIGVASISFIEPTLQPYAATLGITPTGVGLLFLCLSGFYSISTPFIGYALDRKPWKRAFILLGAFGIVLGNLLLGPAPFLSFFIPRESWLLTVALGYCGLAYAFFFIPILPELLECCFERGYPKGLATDSQISGLYTGFSNLGGFAGAALGGILTGTIGFPWTTTVSGALNLGSAVLLSVFFYFSRKRVSGPELDPECEHLLLTNSNSSKTVLS